eukprot:1150394-Pelagomonas_calceolata.AAC.4
MGAHTSLLPKTRTQGWVRQGLGKKGLGEKGARFQGLQGVGLQPENLADRLCTLAKINGCKADPCFHRPKAQANCASAWPSLDAMGGWFSARLDGEADHGAETKLGGQRFKLKAGWVCPCLAFTGYNRRLPGSPTRLAMACFGACQFPTHSCPPPRPGVITEGLDKKSCLHESRGFCMQSMRPDKTEHRLVLMTCADARSGLPPA